jgi:hypothetical protein
MGKPAQNGPRAVAIDTARTHKNPLLEETLRIGAENDRRFLIEFVLMSVNIGAVLAAYGAFWWLTVARLLG